MEDKSRIPRDDDSKNDSQRNASDRALGSCFIDPRGLGKVQILPTHPMFPSTPSIAKTRLAKLGERTESNKSRFWPTKSREC